MATSPSPRARSLVRLCVLLALVPGVPARARAQAGDLNCLIQPHDVVAVSSPVEGIIDKISADRGDLVDEGQVLVSLESSAEKAAVAAAKARVEMEAGIKSSEVRVDFGVRRFVRTDEMYRKELIPLKELDEAETAKLLAEMALIEAHENRRLAQLELDRAEVALALKTIRSPLRGVVLERLLSPGESTAHAPIFRIARLDPLRVDVRVPVSRLGAIQAGTRAQVMPEVPEGSSYAARVRVVDRVVDPATGTFGVRLEVANPDYRLPAGLKCKVRFSP